MCHVEFISVETVGDKLCTDFRKHYSNKKTLRNMKRDTLQHQYELERRRALEKELRESKKSTEELQLELEKRRIVKNKLRESK